MTVIGHESGARGLIGGAFVLLSFYLAAQSTWVLVIAHHAREAHAALSA